jgi:Flp pilus assembly pilin Flp
MSQLQKLLIYFHVDEGGLSSTEYTILLLVLVIGVLAAAATAGEELANSFVGP